MVKRSPFFYTYDEYIRLSVDPLTEKYPGISSYVYCLDNPVRLIDPTGMAPGDVFKTPTAAAKDFGKTYNDNSVELGQEYGSQIYKLKGGYTYTVPNVGGSGSSVTVSSAPKKSKVVADIHTHGSYSYGNFYDNIFSGVQATLAENKQRTANDDIGSNNKLKRIGYLVTPNGSFQMYDPNTGKVTMLSQDMYHDKHDNSSPKTPNPAYTRDVANYVVRLGDSLHSIAEDHKMSANGIIKQNGLKVNIKVGQVLKIYR